VHTAYGYLKGLAFSTYGEASILFAQNVLLLALIYKYNRMPLSRRLAAVILLGGAIAAVLSGECLTVQQQVLQRAIIGATAGAAAAAAAAPHRGCCGLAGNVISDRQCIKAIICDYLNLFHQQCMCFAVLRDQHHACCPMQ
jgi:drug/metabolite transporter (DMT)-like permease